MSIPMYFNPAPEQIEASRNSTCRMATPKDPSDCIGSRCSQWNAQDNKPCAHNYRPRNVAIVQDVAAREAGQ